MFENTNFTFIILLGSPFDMKCRIKIFIIFKNRCWVGPRNINTKLKELRK